MRAYFDHVAATLTRSHKASFTLKLERLRRIFEQNKVHFGLIKEAAHHLGEDSLTTCPLALVGVVVYVLEKNCDRATKISLQPSPTTQLLSAVSHT